MSHKYAVDTERAKECQRLVNELEDFDEELSEKEKEFLSNIEMRLDTYGEKTFISDDQYKWLCDIYSRILE